MQRYYFLLNTVLQVRYSDVLNVAMFGMIAKMWREENPNQKGNIRYYASINVAPIEDSQTKCNFLGGC